MSREIADTLVVRCRVDSVDHLVLAAERRPRSDPIGALDMYVALYMMLFDPCDAVQSV